MIALRAACDEDLAALIAEARVADVETLQHIRRITSRLHAAGEHLSWLMIAGDVVVGLIGYHAPPSADGVVAIGYNVAPECERRGYATAAGGLVIENARADARITAIVAETDVGNIGSQIVLERNGFAQTGRIAGDEPSGASFRWRLSLR
jgi:RimJ/RimL family protein N-acetyltransferase